ncbi:MAG: GldG family protein [Spirochaetaceae bacterium]|nr:GldG family protein [Spirochaetaceae bacterium]
MKRKKTEMITLSLLLFSLIPAILIISQLNRNIDLTDKKIYTIKNGTVEILNHFEQPLYITWWKSDEFESSQLKMVSEFLKQMSRSSLYDLSVDIKIPSADDQRRLKELGLSEEQIEINTKGEIQKINIFSGLEINYLESREIVPFIAGPDNLEFLIAEALTKLKNGGLKTLAIFPDSSADKPNGSYSLLISQLSRFFDVYPLSEDTPLTFIPDIMIVPDRKDFLMNELYAIDRTIQEGSPLIFLVDGLKIDPENNDYAVRVDSSIISRWIESYGVVLGDALISDENSLLLNYMSGNSQRYDFYNMWFKGSDHFDVLWGSPIQIIEKENITYKTIIQSSSNSWLSEGNTDIRPEAYKDANLFTGPYTVCVQLNGLFNPLFKSSVQSEKENNILVFSSTLSFSDFMQSSGSMKNIVYIRNYIYKLLGDEILYDISSRSNEYHLLHRNTIYTGRGQGVVKILTFIIVPFLFSFVYLALLFRQRRSRRGE